jgi:hypothetical protein
VQNPIDDPVIVDLQQILPAGSTIIDPGAGTLSTNQLLWEVDLQPGESRLIQVTLNLPSPLGQPPLSNTVATVYDQVDATWLQFQAAPTLIQVTQSPQAQLQTLGFTSQGLGLALQTFAPGVYRVEATKDFKAWTPVVTCTNVQGLINVQDPAALTNAFRFYRAVQIQ